MTQRMCLNGSPSIGKAGFMIPIVSAFGSGIFPIGLDLPPLPGVEPGQIKAALRHMVGSVSVITAGEGRDRTGATVTSAYGLSVDPAAMIVTINRESSTYKAIRDYGHFCVNVLRQGQEELANRFAGFGGVKGAERYAGHDWAVLKSGALALQDGLLAIDCVLEDEIRKFSHAIFVGRVVALESNPGEALLYNHGGYGVFARPASAE